MNSSRFEVFKRYLLNHWSNLTELFLVIPSTKIAQMVLLNGSAQMDKRIARALDKKYILTTSSPETLVHIQNNFTEFFLVMPFTKLHKWFHSAEQKDHQSSR